MGRRFLYNPFKTESDKELQHEVDYYHSVNEDLPKKDADGQEIEKRKIVASNVELRWDRDCIPEYPWMERRSRSKKPLKEVGNDDIVVINAHGSGAQVAIGYHTGLMGTNGTDEVRLLSAGRLSEMIEQDGLDPNHRVIKLNSCYGAGSDKIAVDLSFAATLARKLGNLGYGSIRVGAYEGKLARTSGAPGTGKHVKGIPVERVHRHWFGPDGTEVDSPFPDKEKKKDERAVERAKVEAANAAREGGHAYPSPII